MTPPEKDRLVEFIEAMNGYNERIRDHAREENKLIDELAELNERIKKLELLTTEAIIGERENGKPRFSNETAREVELYKRLDQNGDYLKLRAERREKGMALGNFKIEREFKLRQLQIWRSVLTIGV